MAQPTDTPELDVLVDSIGERAHYIHGYASIPDHLI